MIDFDNISGQFRFTRDCFDYIVFMNDGTKLIDYGLMMSRNNMMSIIDVISHFPESDVPKDKFIYENENMLIESIRLITWKDTIVKYTGKPRGLKFVF